MKGYNKSATGRRNKISKTFSDELKKLGEKKLLRKISCLESSDKSKIVIKGKTYVNFSSNDYLNLSGNSEVIKGAAAALRKYGLGSGASRLMSGTYLPHMELEKRIAKFKKTQAALVFNTGYAANTGIIPAVAGDDAVIFSDELNHASIVDGARLSRAHVEVYGHRDVDHLESLIKKTFKSAFIKKRFIITDTVFSMDGDIAPLNDLVFLKNKYHAILMIDDAHGTGVLGRTGRGGLEHFGIEPDCIIQMGTLSKAAGCYGAFAAGSKDLIDLLVNKTRSFIYSTSLPPSLCEAGVIAIDIIEGSDGLRRKLWKNRERLYEGLNASGFNTLDSETPIIPILIGSADAALKSARYLYKNKIFAPAIRPPTVPDGKCRIRFSVTAGHTSDDIYLALESLRRFIK